MIVKERGQGSGSACDGSWPRIGLQCLQPRDLQPPGPSRGPTLAGRIGLLGHVTTAAGRCLKGRGGRVRAACPVGPPGHTSRRSNSRRFPSTRALHTQQRHRPLGVTTPADGRLRVYLTGGTGVYGSATTARQRTPAPGRGRGAPGSVRLSDGPARERRRSVMLIRFGSTMITVSDQHLQLD